MSVLVVGSVAFDTVETPFGHREEMLGGSATYFSAAAQIFAPTAMVAVVGDDFDSEHRAFFERRGVDVSGLEQRPGRTFRWGGAYSADFERRTTRFTELNVFTEFDPVLSERARRASWVFLGNIAPELQLRVLDQVEQPRFVACDTMNFWIEGPHRPALDELLERVDALIINDEELRLLTGRHSVLAAARGMQRRGGPRTLVIKRGEHGALMFHNGDTFYTPAYPLEEVVDPTGAGDSFAGGFVGYLARTGRVDSTVLRQAVVAGTLVASFTVEGFGLEGLATLTLERLAQRHEQLRAYTAVEPPVLSGSTSK